MPGLTTGRKGIRFGSCNTDGKHGRHRTDRLNKKNQLAHNLKSFWQKDDGIRLRTYYYSAITALPPGCGTASISERNLTALTQLCTDIVQGSSPLGWGDQSTDKKTKAFGVLPTLTDYPSAEYIANKGVKFHDEHSTKTLDQALIRQALIKHRNTITKAFVSLNPTDEQTAAIHAVIEAVNKILHRKSIASQLKPYELNAVTIANLVALQPNLHNGDDYLPLHLDNPLHDGFGVVIVTVPIYGLADIVLVDEGELNDHTAKPVSWKFRIGPRKLYVLSGHARNRCAHGVVVLDDAQQKNLSLVLDAAGLKVPRHMPAAQYTATEGSIYTGRVSLTFRFSLHTPEQATDDIDSHWLDSDM